MQSGRYLGRVKATPANTATDRATTLIRRATRAGAVVITKHARERMHQRGISPAEIADALMGGLVVADRTEPDHWLVIGDVTVAVALYVDPRAVVLTGMH